MAGFVHILGPKDYEDGVLRPDERACSTDAPFVVRDVCSTDPVQVVFHEPATYSGGVWCCPACGCFDDAAGAA